MFVKLTVLQILAYLLLFHIHIMVKSILKLLVYLAVLVLIQLLIRPIVLNIVHIMQMVSHCLNIIVNAMKPVIKTL